MHYFSGRLREAAGSYYQAILEYEKSEAYVEEAFLMTAHSLMKVHKTQKDYREAETLLLYLSRFCFREIVSHGSDSAVSRHLINILAPLEEFNRTHWKPQLEKSGSAWEILSQHSSS